MTCEECRRALLDAALGEGSPELEAHLSGCAPCHAALASERDLLGRIDVELQESMAVEPSPAFLPVVRRRVAELRTTPEGVRAEPGFAEPPSFDQTFETAGRET